MCFEEPRLTVSYCVFVVSLFRSFHSTCSTRNTVLWKLLRYNVQRIYSVMEIVAMIAIKYNEDRYDTVMFAELYCTTEIVHDTVLVALAISALAIPYDGDQYDTVLVALEISYNGNRVGDAFAANVVVIVVPL